MEFSPEMNPTITPEKTKGESNEGDIEKREEINATREYLTHILTSANAHKEITTLMRTEKFVEVLPEVAALNGLRHNVEGHDAHFHREGDVLRHTLNVMRAPNLPQMRELIADVYNGIDTEQSGEEIVENFYKEIGPEVAWTLLLHDIGKKHTQETPKKSTGENIGHHSFHDHGPVAAQIFAEEIAPRLAFPEEQAEKITILIRDHMLMHKLMRGKSNLTEEERTQIDNHPYKKELLWIALADSLGNYTEKDKSPKATKASREKKTNDARAALEQISDELPAQEAAA